MNEKITVMIAEDMQPLRKKYVMVLQGDARIEVVGDVGTGREACELAQTLLPDVVLMDIAMETKDAGIRAMERILSFRPDTKIIVLTIYEKEETVFAAFQMGAYDYVLKNATNETIIDAVIGAYHNKSPIRSEIAEKLRGEFRRVKNYESSFLFMLNLLSSLTAKELDTLYLLSNGCTRNEVCRMRYVEMSTVKSQVNSILRKTGKKRVQDIIVSDGDRQLLLFILNKGSADDAPV